jgi:hypothetical protein
MNKTHSEPYIRLLFNGNLPKQRLRNCRTHTKAPREAAVSRIANPFDFLRRTPLLPVDRPGLRHVAAFGDPNGTACLRARLIGKGASGTARASTPWNSRSKG